ncbi:TIGR03088 family PEP-CTERM/XrtA system glycosyltransferase [Glaciimonas sp. CA11.2]|uniref:TIGR03088 family PEP-CTERM/XrtA system glycosyltransferase n=2 Tax=Glaciimonas sp. CA11.2 TaxID=3048601 RepID=UPI002AB59648|nr:TIGR03088 family PEP-CTERM/XrtA system glycosyltransferase [Glaciimonas sp. CA11.2]MDY7544684.1 TIGR03088 family PEP-CTERM/XrtA system glycosyltransferase [Glaciimonas sp. CA11.2]
MPIIKNIRAGIEPVIVTTNIPLVVHLLYRLDFGGLETLMVDCINRMPADKYRHAVVCLTDYTAFSEKITKPNVRIFSLHKPAGLGLSAHLKLWRLLRQLRPTILHTYNLSALEYGVTAAMANVPVRVHGEHGRDASDPDGTNQRHNRLRRWLLPFYDCYYAVSTDLCNWLTTTIGVPDKKNLLLANGIDTNTFHPPSGAQSMLSEKLPAGSFVIGTVGRLQDVKNHAGLIDAFILLLTLIPEKKSQLRLAIVGDGPLLPLLKEKITAAGLADQIWLSGARTDVAEIMRTFSLFVLSSIAEGTPITILEAMATGLPVLSTRVGGVPEVVVENITGTLVSASDPVALANAMAWYVNHPDLVIQHGVAGKARVEKQYGMAAMLASYTNMYDDMSTAKKITLGRG